MEKLKYIFTVAYRNQDGPGHLNVIATDVEQAIEKVRAHLSCPTNFMIERVYPSHRVDIE